MLPLNICRGFEYNHGESPIMKKPNSNEIKFRSRGYDFNGMIVFHRYEFQDSTSLSYSDEETKVNYIRLSLMEEFPEIRVQEFSIYYETLNQNNTLENYISDLPNDCNKIIEVFKIFIKLIDLIQRVHSLRICKMRIKAYEIFIVDGEIKLYFPTDMHKYSSDFEKNEGRIEPLNGFEEDLMDFAFLISFCLENPIKYKGREINELIAQIEDIKIDYPRFDKVWELIKEIYCQELTFNEIETVKKRLEQIAHELDIRFN